MTVLSSIMLRLRLLLILQLYHAYILLPWILILSSKDSRYDVSSSSVVFAMQQSPKEFVNYNNPDNINNNNNNGIGPRKRKQTKGVSPNANKPTKRTDYSRAFDRLPNHLVNVLLLDHRRMCRSRSDYKLLRKLGSGKFSDVFEAIAESSESPLLFKEDGNKDELVVVKCLKPVHERKIRREIMVLSQVMNLPNVVQLKGVIWEKEVNSILGQNKTSATLEQNLYELPPTLILEHAGEHSRWLCHGAGMDTYRSLQQRHDATNQDDPVSINATAMMTSAFNSMYLSEEEIKYFIYNLLLALKGLHSRGIMHRDVKPRNVLINRSFPGDEAKRSLCLTDLGLADFYVPGQQYNVRVASRHYKGPELLLGYEFYDYSLDIWGVGCILAGLLLRREPFFRGRDNIDQLAKICAVLGFPDLYDYCEKYDISLSNDLQNAISRKRQNSRRKWVTMCALGCPAPSSDGLDLLDRLLIYDHAQRPSAEEAMQHSFFDSVKNL